MEARERKGKLVQKLIIAAVAAIVGSWITLRNTKGNIMKRIDRKEEQVRKTDYQLNLKYGLNGRAPKVITPLDEKRAKLVSQIEELKRQL